MKADYKKKLLDVLFHTLKRIFCPGSQTSETLYVVQNLNLLSICNDLFWRQYYLNNASKILNTPFTKLYYREFLK